MEVNGAKIIVKEWQFQRKSRKQDDTLETADSCFFFLIYSYGILFTITFIHSYLP